MKFSARSGLASLGVTAALLVSASFANAEDGKLSFSGFADLRYSNYTIEKDGPTVSQANGESGFNVEDGAFYIGYNKEKWSAFIDAPFRRLTNAANASNNGDFVFGAAKAQAFIKYKIADGLNFQFGQFDTIYGVEVNDSKDRIFGKTGLVYDHMLPVTHTGVLLGWEGMGINAKVFAANANNKGSLGDGTPAATNDTTGNNKSEYGAAVGWANEMWHAQLGYMTRSTNKAGSTTGEHDSRTFTELMVGMNWQALAVDLEYSMIKDPSKNVLTTVATDSEDDGTGLLGLVSYKITDAFLVGLRYEMLENGPGLVTTWKDATAIGLAVHHKMDTNLEARAEYTMYSYDAVTAVAPAVQAKDWDESRFNIALLASF